MVTEQFKQQRINFNKNVQNLKFKVKNLDRIILISKSYLNNVESTNEFVSKKISSLLSSFHKFYYKTRYIIIHKLFNLLHLIQSTKIMFNCFYSSAFYFFFCHYTVNIYVTVGLYTYVTNVFHIFLQRIHIWKFACYSWALNLKEIHGWTTAPVYKWNVMLSSG